MCKEIESMVTSPSCTKVRCSSPYASTSRSTIIWKKKKLSRDFLFKPIKSWHVAILHVHQIFLSPYFIRKNIKKKWRREGTKKIQSWQSFCLLGEDWWREKKKHFLGRLLQEEEVSTYLREVFSHFRKEERRTTEKEETSKKKRKHFSEGKATRSEGFGSNKKF